MKKVLVLLLMLVLFSSMFVTGCQKQKQVEQEEQVEEVVEQEEEILETKVVDAEIEQEADR